MRLLRVAAATLNQTPLDWSGNQRNIADAIDRARSEGATLLCLPELCITGYGCEDAFLSAAVHETAFAVLRELAPETHGMAVSFGLPVRHNKANFNSCCLVTDGELRGFVAKRALAGDGIHYEPRWFKPWPLGERSVLEIGGSAYPLGDLQFDLGGIRVGFEICEDAWALRRPGAELHLEMADIVLNPSASHFAFGKHAVRERLVLEGSRSFGVTYVYANLRGNEAGRAIYDGDALIATGGRLVARTSRFQFESCGLIAATVDVDKTRSLSSGSSSFTPVTGVDALSVHVPSELPRATPVHEELSLDPWERSSELKAEEFARSVSLALFDYLRKSRSHGFVVSLSGGADSAAVACLVRLMVAFAVRELGLDGFKDKLSYIAGLAPAASEPALTHELLTTVYQSTRNSTPTTRKAAAELARSLGARHLQFDVDLLVERYRSIVEEALGRELDWAHDDLALQNIQARARAPGVWLLANVQRSLLLSTSNRSEAAVGYATMDGDTSGGLSPIAGIDKAYLQKWLRWLESQGPEGVFALPILSLVNQQAPTAELRPAEQSQTDEADLMPYDVLDAIERAAIRDKLAPLEVFTTVSTDFPQHAPEQVGRWVERFFVLFSRNQWKRERYAPSFHLDDANLDPKTWCRFPILSGGFERELAELREHLGRA